MTGHCLIDKIRISELRKTTNLEPIMDSIRIKTLKLYGHVKRSSTGVSKLCLEGNVPGKRKRGKPQSRWRDNIIK